MGIIGCEWGGGCEWEVVVGVAGAVLRLEERLLPARWQFLEDEGGKFFWQLFYGEILLPRTNGRGASFKIYVAS